MTLQLVAAELVPLVSVPLGLAQLDDSLPIAVEVAYVSAAASKGAEFAPALSTSDSFALAWQLPRVLEWQYSADQQPAWLP